MTERLNSTYRTEPLKEPFPNGEVLDDGLVSDDFDRLMNEHHLTAAEASELAAMHDISQYDIRAVSEIPNDIEIEPPLAPGPSVSLVDRAAALKDITDAYSKQSSVNTIRQKRQANRNNDFDRRYGRRAEYVLAGMESDAKGKYLLAAAAIETLIDRKTLTRQGVPEETISAYYSGMQNDLLRAYGPGVVSADNRRRGIKPAIRVAEKTSRQP